MRQAGLIDTVEGLGSHAHVCWAFDSAEEYRLVAGRFLTDALAGGERVLLIGDAGQIAAFAAGRDPDAAHVRDIGFYAAASQFDPVEFDPVEQVRAYARATEAALADGFAGLRVAVDATGLVATAAGRDAFARYEHLADAYMAAHPMSALCAFDRGRLGAAAVAELACMHPLASAGATPVRLHASADPGITAVLAGEVDVTGHALLRTALERVALRPVDGVVTLDARGLTFIDHRGLLLLAADLRARGAATELLVRPGSGLPQLVALLAVDGLRAVVRP